MTIAIVSFSAISGLGRNEDAVAVAPAGQPARSAITTDEALKAAGLSRPFVARSHPPIDVVEGASDEAQRLIEVALTECLARLDRDLPGWRKRRVGLALATSSGGMCSAERFFDAVSAQAPVDAELARSASYFGGLARLTALANVSFAPATLVLTACAASTIAIGLGMRWLAANECDLVLAGGYDGVSLFVASGFEALRATTASPPPRPFGIGRDGMSLGEGAGVVALVRAADAPRPLAILSGFGASADAVHLTAPDRTGSGVARAARAALKDAGIEGRAIDFVSGHATATPFNDPAECEALRQSLGPDARPVLHGYKAQIGHTLGAAGVLETLACVSALRAGLLPATPISGELEPNLPGRVLAVSEPASVHHALKLSAAFGGANAALVVSTPSGSSASPRASAPLREVFLHRATSVSAAPSVADLAARLGMPAEKLVRTDDLVRLALMACADLVARSGSLPGAGVIVGHALATLETNFSYFARIRERGARQAEPRKFPYTSPNAVAGECGAIFGFAGPGVAVGCGLHGAVAALCDAITLVRAGDADRMVVVAVDEAAAASRAWLTATLGPGLSEAIRPGAVAVAVTASPEGAFARVTRAQSGLGPATWLGPHQPGAARPPWGHAALLPLTAESAPAAIEARCPWGGYAHLELSDRLKG